MNKYILCLIVGSFLFSSLSAAEIDFDRASRGERLRISERALARDYERLYSQQFGLPISWLVYRIIESETGEGPTLLAARLLHPTPAENRLVDRQLDRQVKLGILRELRFREIIGKRQLYVEIIKNEELLDVVEMALLDGMNLDPTFFAPHALRLAIGGNETAYPSSSMLRMRKFVNLVMLNQLGADDGETIQALRYAITHDHLLVTKAVLDALPDGAQPGLSLVALNRVLPRLSTQQGDIAWVIALGALGRAKIPAESPLMQPLVGALGDGGQTFAHAVVRGIREDRIALTPELGAALRALTAQDPVLAMVFEDVLAESTEREEAFQRIEDGRDRVRAFMDP